MRAQTCSTLKAALELQHQAGAFLCKQAPHGAPLASSACWQEIRDLALRSTYSRLLPVCVWGGEATRGSATKYGRGLGLLGTFHQGCWSWFRPLPPECQFQGVCSVALSCPTLCNPMDCSPPGSYFLFQGIFPTQGLNQRLLCLLHR